VKISFERERIGRREEREKEEEEKREK